MMRFAERSLRVPLLLGVLVGCPEHSRDRDAAALLASGTHPSIEEPTACVDQFANSDPASDAQLRALIARCVGHPADFELRRLAVSETEFVVRAVDKAASFTALAWVEQKANALRIVAVTPTAPDTGSPFSLRKETLHGESVIVEDVATRCWESELHWPARPVDPVVGLGAIAQDRRQSADECPRRVERIWLRRERSMLNVGAYAIEGEQRFNAKTTREFSSQVSFDGEFVRVVDDAVWRSWGLPNLQTMDIDAVSSALAEASSRFERIYRLDGLALVEVSGRVPVPKLSPARRRYKPFERLEPCGPPRSWPK